MHLSSPYVLYLFPTERKDPEGRWTWMKLLDRQEDTGKNWEPKPYPRVCSVHFPDGSPTAANVPNIQPGMFFVYAPKSAHKTQTARPPTPETPVDEQSSPVMSTDYPNTTIINVNKLSMHLKILCYNQCAICTCSAKHEQ